jgi:hypothetical protein
VRSVSIINKGVRWQTRRTCRAPGDGDFVAVEAKSTATKSPSPGALQVRRVCHLTPLLMMETDLTVANAAYLQSPR